MARLSVRFYVQAMRALVAEEIDSGTITSARGTPISNRVDEQLTIWAEVGGDRVVGGDGKWLLAVVGQMCAHFVWVLGKKGADILKLVAIEPGDIASGYQVCS